MNYIGFIYMWTNNINSKKYVGSHKGKIDDGYVGSGKAFKKAVKKYGLNNFSRQILEFVYDENDLLKIEQKYLSLYNCAESTEFYNISSNAHGFDSLLGKLASSPNNPNSVNNPNHPDYGKGARIANTNRRKNSPKYNFINIVSNIIELNADAIYMAEKYNLTAHYFRMLGKGKIVIYKDWELYNE